jgi:hypothetical protein
MAPCEQPSSSRTGLLESILQAFGMHLLVTVGFKKRTCFLPTSVDNTACGFVEALIYVYVFSKHIRIGYDCLVNYYFLAAGVVSWPTLFWHSIRIIVELENSFQLRKSGVIVEAAGYFSL